jgi:hypothetical protein
VPDRAAGVWIVGILPLLPWFNFLEVVLGFGMIVDAAEMMVFV